MSTSRYKAIHDDHGFRADVAARDEGRPIVVVDLTPESSSAAPAGPVFPPWLEEKALPHLFAAGAAGSSAAADAAVDRIDCLSAWRALRASLDTLSRPMARVALPQLTYVGDFETESARASSSSSSSSSARATEAEAELLRTTHALKEACANFFASILRNYTLDLYWPTQGTNDEGSDRATPWDGREFDRQMFLKHHVPGSLLKPRTASGSAKGRHFFQLLLRTQSFSDFIERQAYDLKAPPRRDGSGMPSPTQQHAHLAAELEHHQFTYRVDRIVRSQADPLLCADDGLQRDAAAAATSYPTSYPQNLPWPRPGGFDAATGAFPAELHYDAVGGVDDDDDGGLSCASVMGHHSTLARPRQLRDAQELVMEMESMEQKNTLTRRRSSVSGRPERVIASPGARSTSSSRGWLGLWSVKKKGGGRAKAKAKGRAKLAGVSRGKCKAESIEGDVPSERSLSVSQRSSFKRRRITRTTPMSRKRRPAVAGDTSRPVPPPCALLTGDSGGAEMSDATAAAGAGTDSVADACAGPVLTRLIEGVLDEGVRRKIVCSRGEAVLLEKLRSYARGGRQDHDVDQFCAIRAMQIGGRGGRQCARVRGSDGVLPEMCLVRDADNDQPMGRLTATQIDEFKARFAQESGGDDQLAAPALANVVRALGQDPVPPDLQDMIDEATNTNTNAGGATLAFPQFRNMLARSIWCATCAKHISANALRCCFSEADNDGRVTCPHSLDRTLITERKPLHKATVLLKSIDDGSSDGAAFVRVLVAQRPDIAHITQIVDRDGGGRDKLLRLRMPSASDLGDTRVAELQKVFATCESYCDGRIAARDLTSVLRALDDDQRTTAAELQDMIAEVGAATNSGMLGFPEFLNLMARRQLKARLEGRLKTCAEFQFATTCATFYPFIAVGGAPSAAAGNTTAPTVCHYRPPGQWQSGNGRRRQNTLAARLQRFHESSFAGDDTGFVDLFWNVAFALCEWNEALGQQNHDAGAGDASAAAACAPTAAVSDDDVRPESGSGMDSDDMELVDDADMIGSAARPRLKLNGEGDEMETETSACASGGVTPPCAPGTPPPLPVPAPRALAARVTEVAQEGFAPSSCACACTVGTQTVTLPVEQSGVSRTCAAKPAHCRSCAALRMELVLQKNTVQVFCRVRPLRSGQEMVLGLGARTVDVDTAVGGSSGGNASAASTKAIKRFEYDRVFGPSSTQGDVFEHVAPLVQAAASGYSACIFAYGQTGSGKTYTLQGDGGVHTADPDRWGVSQRAVAMLFALGDTAHAELTIELSVLEIYNEALHDLLCPSSEERLPLSIQRRSSGGGGAGAGVGETEVMNLRRLRVSSAAQTLELLHEASQRRTVRGTAMNARSSRSHLVINLSVRTTTRAGAGGDATVQCGSLVIVDLAGSERQSRTHAAAGSTELKEANGINRSLLELRNVVHALAHNSQLPQQQQQGQQQPQARHVPYRNSKLTHMLQGRLGLGGAKTLMLLHASPLEDDTAETLSTLTFGKSVQAVKCSTASRSVESSSALAGRAAAAQLQRQLQSERARHAKERERMEARHADASRETAALAKKFAAAEQRSRELEQRLREADQQRERDAALYQDLKMKLEQAEQRAAQAAAARRGGGPSTPRGIAAIARHKERLLGASSSAGGSARKRPRAAQRTPLTPANQKCRE